MTAEKGYQEVKEHSKAQREKVDAVEKKKQEKKRKDGSLISKNKTDLGDLAAALSLETDGLTVSKLCSEILKYFNDHLEMKEDCHYSGIFSHTRKWPAPVESKNITNHTNNDMHPSPVQRCHLETIPLNVLSPSSSSSLDSCALQQPGSSFYPVPQPSSALPLTTVSHFHLSLFYPPNQYYILPSSSQATPSTDLAENHAYLNPHMYHR
ncbi:hypothetical protein EDD85DRAFT_971799 [Armillaria nabsnona]|nr:hypothetical protein EDD85DRAFT_956739 [Armillaria nabsnona]KAK0231904.1 hypothetical protein EDD85DRAFT_971799 [Armillaria nabsnona]